MKPIINITTSNDGSIAILEDLNVYASEQGSDLLFNNFKYSDTVSIESIILNNNTTYVVNEHNNKDIVLPIKNDGVFSVQHIVVPSKEWYDRNKDSDVLKLLYDSVFYSDGSQLYKDGSIVSFNLLESNLQGRNTVYTSEESIYVSINNLRKCYINVCQLIFENRAFSKCWERSKVDSELIYKRDLIWMAINVIKYLTEKEDLAEVQRILDIINGCNGLCSSNESSYNGCGCSKR